MERSRPNDQALGAAMSEAEMPMAFDRGGLDNETSLKADALATIGTSGEGLPLGRIASGSSYEPELELGPGEEPAPNLLLVDDTPANLRLLMEILMQRGYQVRPVTDGKRAIAAAQLHPPDLILLDIKMPSPDGYEVCQALKSDERTRDIPVIFLTVLDAPMDKAKGFEMGGVDYITKPLEALELLARVDNQLRLRALQKQLMTRNRQLQKLLIQYRETAKALRNSEAKFAKAFDDSPMPMALLTLPGLRYLDANRAFLSQSGYHLDELLGKTSLEIDLWVDSQKREHISEQFQCYGFVHGFEARLRTKGGKARTVFLFLETIQLDDCQYLLSMGQDITQRKAAEQKLIAQAQELSDTLANLRETQGKLVESTKLAALGNLVAGIAHEINTPLGVAITAASTLENELHQLLGECAVQPPTVDLLQEYLELLEECSGLVLGNLARAGELVQSFKQVAVDQVSLRDRSFTVKPYLEEVFINLKPQLKPTPHEVELTGDDQYMIHSYPGALAQVITNLVLNSLRHGFVEGREPGLIQLDVQRGDEGCSLIYRDNGIGISPDNIERIFEPFFTTARPTGGSGLGLYLVYNLVTQRLQGEIAVSSEPGQGVKFVIVLPRKLRLGEVEQSAFRFT